MDLTRTQFGLIALFAGAVLVLAVSTLGVLNPEAVMGMAAGGEGGLSTPLIATMCLTGVGVIANLVGLGTLLSDARHYGAGHLVACVAALLLAVVGTGLPILASVGGASYAQTGDVEAYHRTLQFSSVGVGLAALSMSVAAWHLFMPGWRALPALVALVRVVAGVGAIQATRLHSTLMQRTFGDQTVYMPSFDVPLDSGPVFNWQVAGWAGMVLLGGMWAMLLFDAEDTMRPRLDAGKKRAAPGPADEG